MKKFLATTAIASCLSGSFYAYEAFSQTNTEITTQKIDLSNDEEIHAIVLNGTSDEVQKVVEVGYNVNKIFLCNTLLNTAIKSMAKGQNSAQFPGDAIEKVKILIKAGANVNNNGCAKTLFPLEWAAILPLQMIDMEKDINKILDDKIKTGIEYCDLQGIISKPCKDITPEEQKIIKDTFHQAFKDTRKELTPEFIKMLKLLTENGADINKKDYEGQTALHRAALIPQEETLELIRYLIEHGANINAQDNAGNTPLFVAYAVKNENTIRLLIEKGADTTIKNNIGSLYNQVIGARKRLFDNEDGTVRTELNM